MAGRSAKTKKRHVKFQRGPQSGPVPASPQRSDGEPSGIEDSGIIAWADDVLQWGDAQVTVRPGRDRATYRALARPGYGSHGGRWHM